MRHHQSCCKWYVLIYVKQTNKQKKHYPCPLYPIRTENSVTRRACLFVIPQTVGPSWSGKERSTELPQKVKRKKKERDCLKAKQTAALKVFSVVSSFCRYSVILTS